MNSACKSRIKPWPWASVLVVLFVLSAETPVAGGAEMVPDFALVDVNSTSSTYDQPVSPRDYLQQVSGWYFGHAT